MPNADDPADVASKFVSGKFVRLATPVNPTPGGERSPLLVGHVVVGGTLAALFVGAVVQLRKLSGLWRVLTTVAFTSGVISTNRSAPIRDESRITDVTTQLQQTLQVFSLKGPVVSPRTWGEPPVGTGMLTERGRHLGRASCVLTADATSAIDCHNLAVPTERNLQRLSRRQHD